MSFDSDPCFLLHDDKEKKWNLAQWLQWLETLHPDEIELGLDRISQVAKRLLPELFHADGSQALPFKVITIGGTNGKGSTIAFLQSILIASGYTTGSYTSPHFLTFNERIQVNSNLIADAELCVIFEQIEQLRGNISLTYFEYTTLAAICYFVQQKCDVIVMEVGLGGRLDAVNMIEPSVSLVTTVDLDHQDWLGDTIEAIAYEKSGIFRKNKVAFYGDRNIPDSVVEQANKLDSLLFQYGKDYSYTKNSASWTIFCRLFGCDDLDQLCFPQLAGEIQFKNLCNAIMVLKSLQKELTHICLSSINTGIKRTFVTGRFQHLSSANHIDVFVDVAHNPQAAKILSHTLSETKFSGQTHAIFAILEDKDIAGVIKPLSSCIDSWHIINLDSDRAISAEKIGEHIQIENKNIPISCYNDFSVAYQTLVEQINLMALDTPQLINARIVVFGSFLTVAQALAYFEPNPIKLP